MAESKIVKPFERIKSFSLSSGDSIFDLFNSAEYSTPYFGFVGQNVTGYVRASVDGLLIFSRGGSKWGSFFAISDGKIYTAAFRGSIPSTISWTQIT